jgi:hypothetical protein
MPIVWDVEQLAYRASERENTAQDELTLPSTLVDAKQSGPDYECSQAER